MNLGINGTFSDHLPLPDPLLRRSVRLDLLALTHRLSHRLLFSSPRQPDFSSTPACYKLSLSKFNKSPSEIVLLGLKYYLSDASDNDAGGDSG